MATEPDKKDLKSEIEKTAKLFDVAKPGSTAASATSRPIIVRHSSGMGRDPMVTEKAAETPPTPEEVKAVVSKSHTLKPLEETAVAEEEKPSVEPEKSEEKTEEPKEEEKPKTTGKDIKKVLAKYSDDPREIPAVDKADEEDEDIVPEESTVDVEAKKAKDKAEYEANQDSEHETAKKAAVDSLVNEVSAKRDSQKQKEEYDAVVAEVEASVAKKEYFVPIGLESKRRSKLRVVLGFVVILILLVSLFGLALDAEMIDIGIEPFTDFI